MDFRHDPRTDFRDPDELSREEAAEQVKALREGIDHHDYLYYVKADPKISDATYHRLFARLEELEGCTRSEARRRVEELGGRATDSVSSATDYLVVGDDPGSKLEDARQVDSVEILDEEGFEDLLRG